MDWIGEIKTWAAHPWSPDMDLVGLFLLVSFVFLVALAWYHVTTYFVEG